MTSFWLSWGTNHVVRGGGLDYPVHYAHLRNRDRSDARQGYDTTGLRLARRCP